ncbi:hypothetical protein F5X71_10555 [Nocardia brasiliensis]|uniref:Uncharacterized protein n=1 Tax=Nocardia brasiliensis TaxID=37326 RepID=A0A6G9XP70_NOCBR|nr:hypothetical protein [Nocardia brasiliensis]QIS02704.1 hypothetical protein F5X71_10555 [Nocardia brasiliensis]
MGKRGDKKRAKQRAKQLAQSQRDHAGDPAPKRSPKSAPSADRRVRGEDIKRRSKQMTLVDPESPEGPLTPQKVSESKYMSVEWPPADDAPENAPSIQFLLTITERTVNLSRNTVEVNATPVEDTIHPRPLGFDPPLQQYGKGDAKGFRHYLECSRFCGLGIKPRSD